MNAIRKTTALKHYEATDLDRAFLIDLFARQNGLCYWFGIPMIPSSVYRDPQRPSVDRLDNSIGYLRSNVVLACAAANIGRSSASAERFSAFCTTLRESSHHVDRLLG